MKIFNCFGFMMSKKKNKNNSKSIPPRTNRLLQIKPLEDDKPNINKLIDYKESPIDSYNGGDEHKEKDSTKDEFKEVTTCSENEEEDGHVSDPGLARATSWVTSPKLKRSCSLSKFADRFHSSDPRALDDPKESSEVESTRSHKSADRVMLKKHSSMQILPSGSRRLWWKLFLWSHRNLHSIKSQTVVKNHLSGYTSDFIEQESPSSHQVSPPRHNQWVAFSTESSSMKRVDEWVKGLDVETVVQVNKDECKDNHYETGRSHLVHANSLIQSLSKSSNVAHISSIGLKAIPRISHFTSLKSIDLSNNFIAQITPASLPKGLHALNLSKNKISVIEGLRELTRLRVLDLSYNRISRIGQGLSNCTLIKELYLAGNKIGNIEGLHRLLKLIVLDLSFNKLATTKAIGQLVANYNTLIALNILGNPIQTNLGEDQLRKTVSSLLPKLVYFNRQLTKPQRAREILKDSVAKAVFGGGDSLHHRRKRTSIKRVAGSASPSVHHQGNIADDTPKGKGRVSKRRNQHQLRK